MMPRLGILVGVGLLSVAGLFVIPKLIPTGGVAGEFAADRAATPKVPFDARRALRYLDDICKIGPRISGTDGMRKQQELLKKHFEEHGAKVELQRFPAKQVSLAKPIEMANMIISWHPEQTRRVIVCCHYDTRPIADQEPDRNDWRKPFVSANDGGSGVAFLMELAHHMKDLKTQVGVDFVIFDGEEYIFDRNVDEYFLGSEHFASSYRKNKPKHQYLGAVLLDMIAGKGAKFPVDRLSFFQAGPLVRDIWGIARQEKCNCFVDQLNDTDILDDHVPLNRHGIPAIDIIDFSFEHWHRLSDVPANCTAEPLDQVARVLTIWLQQVR